VRTNPNHGPAIRMHRVILGLGNDDPLDPDHINHDRIDNRRSNLRPVNQSENNANRQKTRGTSRYKGVYWDRGKWVADNREREASQPRSL
jgi:hypothetical protein